VSAHGTIAAMIGLVGAVALVALGLAVWALVQVRRLAPLSHRHERRRRDEGPPPGQPERRHAGEGRARRRDVDNPGWQIAGQVEPEQAVHPRPGPPRNPMFPEAEPEPEQGPASPSGSSSAAGPPTYPPRPEPRHRHPDEPETVEHAPPTADMRTLPPPGSIGHR
jgi:hypothetical protein